MTLLFSIATLCVASAAAQTGPTPGGDWVIPAGQAVTWTTAPGWVRVQSLHVEAGAILRIEGDFPFALRATDSIRVDGQLDLSGRSAPGVLTLNTGNIPELGAPGTAAGGRGGTGSAQTTSTTLFGGDGFSPYHATGVGKGGESAISVLSTSISDSRRPGGGGGGALGPDRPLVADPLHPSNYGLIVQDGWAGSTNGMGVSTLISPAPGGGRGSTPFTDGNTSNDFWGTRLDAVTGLTIAGELIRPVSGSGGGAGGDAVMSPIIPGTWNPTQDEKGAGGGGGGGLGVLISDGVFSVGPAGSIRADGGAGGGGENTSFFDRVGGGSGGGSGGYLVLQAVQMDLSQAAPNSISALGGRGGVGRNDQNDTINAGGNGGPGIIQVHVPALQQPLLAAGALEALSSPDAVELLPIL